MKAIEVYDKAMCCSTGVCGPQVDPVLAQFAADLQWLGQQGVTVKRFNLAHDPGAFANNPLVQDMLTSDGIDCLPLVLINGSVMSRAAYPVRESLASWFDIQTLSPSLPITEPGSGCCGGGEC